MFRDEVRQPEVVPEVEQLGVGFLAIGTCKIWNGVEFEPFPGGFAEAFGELQRLSPFSWLLFLGVGRFDGHRALFDGEFQHRKRESWSLSAPDERAQNR